MKSGTFLWLSVAVFVALSGCGRTGATCVTSLDCGSGQVCTADGCVDLINPTGGGAGGGFVGGGAGGGFIGGGAGGGFGGGAGGGFIGGGAGGGFIDGGPGGGVGGGFIGGGAGGGFGGGFGGGAGGGGVCPAGFADCDNNPNNGCESNLNSPNTCGSCNNFCPPTQNGTRTCSASTCGVICANNFGDCDGVLFNGCEARLTSPTSCGACSTVCSMSQSCSNQMCAACPASRTLPLNTTVMGSVPQSLGVLTPPSCANNSVGGEELWTLSIPSTALVTLETGGNLDTVLYVRAACGSTADLACNDDTPAIGQLSRIVMTMQPGTYFVLVKRWGPGGSGPVRDYTLSATAVTNTTCAAATTLSPGTALSQNSVNGATPSSTCSSASGGELFYQLDLPPNHRGEIRVTPAGTASLTTRLRDTCASATCLSSSQGVTTQIVTLDNPSGATRSMRVSVAATTAAHSTFTIEGTLTALPARPYLISPITAACDDMSMEPDVLGPATMPVIDDDVTTTALALPFAFSYFGAPVTHYSLTTNGFAQLHQSVMSATSDAFQNVAMPNTAQPNAIVAPLWDDLTPASVATSTIRVRTLGASPLRTLTAQWSDFRFLQGGNRPERLNFQLKFFETTGVIEFHYCSMLLNGGDPAVLSGGTSTVGVENLTGTDAVMHSHLTPNSVINGQGLRFTPP